MTASSSQFYTAITTKQYEALIQIYGNVAIEALQNHQNIQLRWNNSCERNHYNNGRSSREEKFDESFINLLAAGYSPPRRGNNENRSPTHSTLTGGGTYHSRSSNSIAACGDLLREFTSFLYHPEQNHELSESASSSRTTSSTATSLQWDAGQVVRDAVCSLTEIRPPPDFSIYPGGVIVHSNNETETAAGTLAHTLGANNNVDVQTVTTIDSQTRTGPPIFDGAIANATPNFGTSGGGGIGTAIHAVAAVDHPLTLALLLAMGADTRASHTAFRRLVQHEAACNGSIQCLTLLLELGNRYGEELMTRNDSTTLLNHSPSDETSSSTGSPDSLLDFPFFSRRSNAVAGKLSLLHSKSMKLWKKSSDDTSLMPANILSLLRFFHTMATQVNEGSISELDAARLLVQRATLSDETKVALAIQCGYHIDKNDYVAAGIITPFNRRSTNTTISADGHGNTPLHWAAFKNETTCISLLLKYRADPNARAHPSGWTPLHDAAYSNGRGAISLLMDAGAMVDARASSGATPLCFAAQEDAAEAVELLLIRGADLGTRCAAEFASTGSDNATEGSSAERPLQQTRFSGYTPLHYCAHYNASKAAKALLQHHTALAATEIRDLNGRLPIHIAVARGSSSVLRELLVAGARVETRALHRHHSSAKSASPTRRHSRRTRSHNNTNDPENSISTELAHSAPSTPRRNTTEEMDVEDTSVATTTRPSTPQRNAQGGRSDTVTGATSVSSPLLRSMIPSQPVQSSKPWNCLTQRSIDECRQLISEVEQNWTPDRHSLFTPADRRAVAALLRVGQRLEAEGSFSFIYLWPEVLSFCGRGWFEVEEDDTEATDIDILDEAAGKEHLSLPTFC